MAISLIETLTVPPGLCRTCGSSSKDWYLDTGISEKFYGAVVYCCDCIADMANKCGFLLPEVKRKLEEELRIEKEKNFVLSSKIESLKGVEDGIRHYLDGLNNPDDDNSSNSNPGSILQTLDEGARIPALTRNFLGSGEGETSKSDNDSKMV